MENKCICCGDDIPEGLHVCPICVMKQFKEEQDSVYKQDYIRRRRQNENINVDRMVNRP